MINFRRGKCTRVISVLLVFTFIMSGTAQASDRDTSPVQILSTLSPQSMSNPIDDATIHERGVLGALIMKVINRDSAILSRGMNLTAFVRDKNIDLFFSSARPIGLEGTVLPCDVSGERYYAYVVPESAGKFNVASVRTEEEYQSDMDMLRDRREAGQEGVMPSAREDLFRYGANANLYVLDDTDRSVRMLSGFFETLRASGLSKALAEALDAGKVCVYDVPGQEDPVVSDDVVAERARHILNNMLAELGVDPAGTLERYKAALTEYAAKGGNIDIESFDPELAGHARRINTGEQSVSNEGGIIFANEAYTMAYDLSVYDNHPNIPIVLGHIEETFNFIAYHDAEKYNASAPDDRKVRPEDRPTFEVVSESFSRCMLPTFLVTDRRHEEGKGYIEVKVNPYFVKVMAHLLTKYMNDSFMYGGIELPTGKRMITYKRGDEGEGPQYLGTIYESILFSAVIHEVRGHFPINEWGFFQLNPDEAIAQGERGRSRQYVNVLAILFYWINMVEQSNFPGIRAKQFLKEHPELVRGLDERLVEGLPDHLMEFSLKVQDAGLFTMRMRRLVEGVQGVYASETGVDADYYRRTFLGEGGTSSNDGRIDFSAAVFERMPDIRNVPLSECKVTIDRIFEIFEDVATHKIRKHNEAVERGEKKHAIPEGTTDIPRAKIVITPLSDTVVPSAVVTQDGTVAINQNFIRVMELLRRKGANDPRKASMKMRTWGPAMESTLFDSIIYSMALHETGGHFEIEEHGFPVFQPDEEHAQGKRGRSSLYTNLLAVVYYWSSVVQQHPHPDIYAMKLMQDHPYMFEGLTPEQRGAFPRDILKLARQMQRAGVSIRYDEFIPTGTTKEEVMRSVAGYGDAAAWNEGALTGGTTDDMKAMFSPVGVFTLIKAQKGRFAVDHLVFMTGENHRNDVTAAVELLERSGYIRKQDGGAYQAALLTPEQEQEIKRVLSAGDMQGAVPLITGIMQLNHARALLDIFGEAAEERTAVTYFLETDWIPEEQLAIMRPLIQEVRKMAGNKGIELIVQAPDEDADQFLARAVTISEALSEGHKKTVYLGSAGVVEGNRLMGNFKNKPGAVVVGVSGENINPSTYIKLLEMMRMSLRLALNGLEGFSLESHPSIDWYYNRDGSIIFIQKPAEPFDIQQNKHIYDLQRRVVTSA